MNSKTTASTSQTALAPSWVRVKLAHLLVHLKAREDWKTKVVSEASKRRRDHIGFEFPGLTDLAWPCNWGITHEGLTMKIILGRDLKVGESYKQAMQAVCDFLDKNLHILGEGDVSFVDGTEEANLRKHKEGLKAVQQTSKSDSN